MKPSEKSINLKLDKEALKNGFIVLEADNNEEILEEEKLEQLENEYGIYGELILTKDYKLVYLDHAILNEKF